MLTPEKSVFIAILLCLAGAVITAILRQRKLCGIVAFLITVATAIFIYYASFDVLINGHQKAVTFLSNKSLGFALRVFVDGLSAWFLILAATIAIPSMFFSIKYMEHYEDYNVSNYYPYILMFLAAMYGLLSTTDMMWFFFIFWQMMTISGFFLIRFERKNRANIKASNKFMIMMQIACFVTMLGAAMISGGEASLDNEKLLRYDFDAVQQHIGSLLTEKPTLSAMAFLMFLIGFGIKLGMWPFGKIWLPDAHPAAPSPVSAMLSGVMIKTGVYGIMRYFVWLVPPEKWQLFPSRYWGLIISLLGIITLLTGTAQALRQEQTKRLLAFHSIGQIGYILLGIGAAIALSYYSNPLALTLGAVAIAGALFHTFNHGLFKSLLFLNAGSILYRTNTQDLNKLGGLISIMPLTAITSFIASMSISGVPPLNGFASKWSIYVGAIQGGKFAPYLIPLGFIAIFTSGLTLASFIKFFGASFLSRKSAFVSEKIVKSELNWSMLLPQFLLAALCLFFGIFPYFGLVGIQSALKNSAAGFGNTFGGVNLFEGGALSGVGYNEGSFISPLMVVIALVLFSLLAILIMKLGRSEKRASNQWLCGYVVEDDAARYNAHNFYYQIKQIFKGSRKL